MASSTKLLYIGLYPSGEEKRRKKEDRKYHWAFLVGPENEGEKIVPGTMYHIKKHVFDGWVYEEQDLDNVCNKGTLLVRILIAKITDQERVAEIIRSIELRQNVPEWKCFHWLGTALKELEDAEPSVGVTALGWTRVSTFARWYVERKTDAGRFMDSNLALATRPTWDMLEGKEIHS